MIAVAGHRGFLVLMPAYTGTALETKLVANSEISSQLFLSLKTVQSHVSTIFRKSQVAGRTQAAIRAREAGLGDGP
jgi:ATP/maltotriose-dependent transcriptional regulator MalT